jgi:hypothetical protein
MPESAPNTILLRSLGRLVRGLSALFWGLPLTLIACFYTAKMEGLKWFGVPAVICSGLLVFGLWEMGAFQPQERIWHTALDRARVLALINFGLSPFLYWYNRVSNNLFFIVMVITMVLAGVLFLGSLNLVLQRLGAMLPDEALRQETRQFTSLNLNLLGATLLLGTAWVVLGEIENLPPWLRTIAASIEHASFWFLIPLVLLPIAMTMALLWKTKEVILDSVFRAEE